MTNEGSPARTRVAVVLVGAAFVAVHAHLLWDFLPNRAGFLGHDYNYFLPWLLEGMQQATLSGPWASPPFSPAFCGGVPWAANPQSVFFSLPQWLAFLGGPIAGVRGMVVVMGLCALFGGYALARTGLSAPRGAAMFAGVLFLYNGFFIDRMIVGHLTMHGVMLLPAMLALALRPRAVWNQEVIGVAAMAGLALYWLHSGAGTLLLPFALALAGAVLTREVLLGLSTRAWARLTAAAVVAALLGAGKLVAAQSFLAEFPRSWPAVGGFDGIVQSVGASVRLLALGPAALQPSEIVGEHWHVARHEVEVSVSPVPLWFIALALVLAWRSGQLRAAVRERGRLVRAGLLLVVVAVPVVLNAHGNAANAVLISLPILRESATHVRWLIALIPAIVIACVLGAAVIARATRTGAWVVAFASLGVAAFQLQVDRSAYQGERYDPRAIERHAAQILAGAPPQAITTIEAHIDVNGTMQRSADINDGLVRGASPALCYEPVFGYRLERFPSGSLHPGAVDEVDAGTASLNLKDPSCYVWPNANQCEPGAHFSLARAKDARAFAQRRPFPFRVSAAQRLADGVSGVTAVAMAVTLLVALAAMVRRRQR